MDQVVLGNVLTALQIAVIVLGGFYALWRMDSKLQLLGVAYTGVITRLDKVDTRLDGLVTITVQLAKQEERMNAQDQRVQEISNRLETVKFLQGEQISKINKSVGKR